MNGKIVGIGLLAVTALAGAGMWYLQEHYYYREVPVSDHPAALTLTGPDGAPIELPVTDYRAIRSISTPIGNRACFRTDPALAATGQPYPDPTPTGAPGWFDCFDYARLTLDIDSGTARAVLVTKSVAPKIDSVLAVYPDGRAFEWRQQNEEAAEKRTID